MSRGSRARAPRCATTAKRRFAAALPLLAAAAATLFAADAGARPPRGEDHKAELRVALDRTAYPPGSTARLAAVLTIERGWHVNAHEPTFEWLIPTALELETPDGWAAPEVRYPEAEHKAFAFAEEQPLAVYEGTVTIVAAVGVPAGAAAGSHPLTAAVRYQACDDRSCLPPVTATAALELTVGEGGAAQHQDLFDGGAGGAASEGGGPGLALILLLGLVGGLILNAMPCVLPVLSIKVLGLVQSAGHGRAGVVVGALATAGGILASFWALALTAIGARAAGAAVGWGVQFQQPGFVAFLAVVVVLFCLNLWGLFEIPLPARLANTLGAGGPREGIAGHFAAGLFATLMATPCSAPFLGTAVGFALAQPAAKVLAVFTAVALGMALPYLVLAALPGAARLLPRPGPWMDGLKKLMGFLLAAAAIWLFYVLAAQVGPGRLAAIQLALLALALFVWARGRAARTPGGRRLAAAGVAAAAVATLGLAAAPGGAAPATQTATVARIPWVEFDRAEAESLAEERLVFVDVTADWCFTCKTNERLVLETAEIAELFERHDVVAMKADWTNRDDDVAAYLAAHGRYSIPFYLLYRPGAEPHLFSELLTKNAIQEAVGPTSR